MKRNDPRCTYGTPMTRTAQLMPQVVQDKVFARIEAMNNAARVKIAEENAN